MSESAHVSDPVRELTGHVALSPAPLLLLSLANRTMLEVSEPFLAWSGYRRADLVGRSVEVLLGPDQPVDAQLRLLREGELDAYTRRRQVHRADGSVLAADVHVSSSSERGLRSTALVTVLAGPGEGRMGPPGDVDAADVTVLGTVADSWQIERVTAEVRDLLGVSAASLVASNLRDLVHPGDLATLDRLCDQARETGGAAAGRLRLRHDGLGYLTCRLALAELIGVGPRQLAFCLSPLLERGQAEDAARARTLKAHLHRIAREVLASGVAQWSTAVPTASELPELSRLSAREYEIVVRLATGERVSAIARALFLSESTVRNHLTGVYRKLGVGSQEELLTRLSARS